MLFPDSAHDSSLSRMPFRETTLLTHNLIVSPRNSIVKHQIAHCKICHTFVNFPSPLFQIMTVTADEINYLLRRYLQETGFPHTAYVFANECLLDRANIQVTLPPQALVTILKKGMLYMQMEKGINEKAKTDDSRESIILSMIDTVRREEPVVPAKQRQSVKPLVSQQPKETKPHIQRAQASVKLPVIYPVTITNPLKLKSHYSDVYCGAWTRDGRYLATGSGDATAVIWEIRNHEYIQHYILDHATHQERQNKDIAALAWNPAGTILATGCYDGSARLWTNRGELKSVLQAHTDPVFTVHFSPNGSLLLTGGSDSKVLVWTDRGELRQTFQNHSSRVLDVDWLDDDIFASCSGDARIAICQIGRVGPLYMLDGHHGEVNKIEWEKSSRMLASCSDDKTVCVWRPLERAGHMPLVLQGHTHHVYTIKWAPGNRKILASGAFDYTVRLWDAINGSCLAVVRKHKQPIYTVCFSPKGDFFVSGGIDNEMNMWRKQDAALVETYDAHSGIFEAQWDPTGENIALCLSDASVEVIDTRSIANFQE